MGENHPALDTGTTTSWAPSAELRSALGAGTWATLALGIIAVVGSAGTLLEPQGVGSAIIHGLGWLALVPAFWVFLAYWKLGMETQYHGLLVSSGCLFGALILVQIYDLISLEALPWLGQAALWVVFVLGMIFLAVLPFSLYGVVAATIIPEADKTRIIAGSAKL
jgi:hypothetical protein